MLGMIKSEFTKIFSLRSTYIIAGVLVLIAIIAGIVAIQAEEFAAGVSSAISNTSIQAAVTGALNTSIAIIIILSAFTVLSEYRYGTMAYTVAASRSRLNVFMAKVVAVIGQGLGMSLIISIVAFITASMAISLSGHDLSAQEFNIGSALWHLGLYLSAHILVGLFLGLIIRNSIIVIVVVFVVPVVENMAIFLLKDNAVYLPFRAMGTLANGGESAPAASVTVMAVLYVLALGAIALTTFLKRDT